ncbi:MAG TPA: polyamine aminopropyltransferase [Longimicrobium sp.]|uniref:polyamine aminopropyltransferase n=1 Tax=Longimicrobium sp. TaxID=2029185 RepID=UPI002EDAE848
MNAALFVTVLLIAACGLIYELVAGALASYLLGDSVLQFSTIIGTYLFAMGVGSWLSRFIHRGLASRFVSIELMVAVVGGFSSTLLFLAFAYTDAFRPLLYLLVSLIGIFVGLEIPLLMRLLRDRLEFKDVVANVLTFDYLGALGASLLFPLVLVPYLGMARSALLFGIINAAVALWSTYLFRDALPNRRRLQVGSVFVLALLVAGFAAAERITRTAESSLYADPVVLTRNSPYQRIVLTAWRGDLRLFLNGHLQFSSRDEYRYHEALVHPGLAAHPSPKRVLVLGGGDGLAVREVLRYPGAEVTLVDLDAEMTRLFSKHGEMLKLNGGALLSPRVRVINADAFRWLAESSETFDFAVVDLPDPSNYAVGKLYTTTFYRLLRQHLNPGGMMVVQSTSPLFARTAFWSIERTLGEAGLRTWPYHVYVPSFGEWGFILAGTGEYRTPARLPDGLRYLTAEAVAGLFQFPTDMRRVPVRANRLDDQVLVRYYSSEWEQITQ